MAAAFCYMAVPYFVDSLLSCCLLCDPPTIWIELKPSHCTAGHRELTSTHHQTLATTFSTFGGDKAQEIRQSSEVAGTVLPSLVSALPFGRFLIEPSQTKCVWDSGHPAPVRLCPGQTPSPDPGPPRDPAASAPIFGHRPAGAFGLHLPLPRVRSQSGSLPQDSFSLKREGSRSPWEGTTEPRYYLPLIPPCLELNLFPSRHLTARLHRGIKPGCPGQSRARPALSSPPPGVFYPSLQAEG